jgi:hypothetical protein
MVGARRATTAAFATTAVAVVAILVLWVFPGYLSVPSNCPIHTSVSGRDYCAEAVTLEQCTGPFCPALPFPGFEFHEVTFDLSLGGFSGAATVTGWVTELNSTRYPVYLLGDNFGPPFVNWTSPDHAVLIEWQAPFTTHENGTVLNIANVTCGVMIATTTVP